MNSEQKNIKCFKIFPAILIAICGALSLCVVYTIPSIEDSRAKINEMLTLFYIPGLNPWPGEPTGPLILLGKLGCNFSDFSVGSIIIAISLFLCCLFCEKFRVDVQKKKSYRIITWIVAMIFGLLQVAGLSVHYNAALIFCSAGTYQQLLALFVAAGYAFIFKLFFDGAYIGKCILAEKMATGVRSNPSAQREKCNQKELLITFAVLFGIYLIWIIVYRPGSVDWDSHAAVKFLLTGNKNQHHPVLSTWLHVGPLLLRRSLGSDAIGVLVYLFFHTLVCVYGFTRTIWVQQKLGMPVMVRRLSVVFWAIVPVFGIFIQSTVKNTLFMGVFLIFLTNLAEILLIGNHHKKAFVKMIISAIFSCLLLKNGVYVVCILLAVLAVTEGLIKKRRSFIIAFAAVLATNIACSVLFTYGFGYEKTAENGAGEALSLPIICTSYYVRQTIDELTEEEREVLSHVFTCEPEQLAAGYIRGLSDGAKGYWNKNATLGETLDYALLWIKQGIAHPVMYCEALLNQTYGYYVLAPTDTIVNGNKESYMDYQMDYSPVSYHVVYTGNAKVRDLASAATHLFERSPVTGFLTNQGLTTWILIAMLLMFFFSREHRKCYLAIVLLLFVLSCVASPVNGCLRYYLPVFGAMPLMWSAFLSKYGKDSCQE